MEVRSDSETESDSSLVMCEKRSSVELGENADHARKRLKMRELESVIRSVGMLTHQQKISNTIDANKPQFSQGETPQVTNDDLPLNLNGVSIQRIARETLPQSVYNALKPLDHITKVSATESLASGGTMRAGGSRKSMLLRKDDRNKEVEAVNSRISCFDLNSENLDDVSSSVRHSHSYPYKKPDHSKSKTISTGPLEPRDPLMEWKVMKKNGFHSAPHHGGIPMPIQAAHKGNDDLMKKKMEIAKKEEVDKFAEMTAPSGLLSKLNPGIITNVRNMKQVRSIIQSLVRSERLEKDNLDSKQESELNSGKKEAGDNDKENSNARTVRLSFTQKNDSNKCSSGSRQTSEHQMPIINKPISLCLEERSRDAVVQIFDVDSTPGTEDDSHTQKLTSSMANALQNVSFLSSENLGSVSFLSVKAATVASQWLELLHQDITGRLGALRRSKKKVRAVLHTELPLLFMKEFVSSQANNPFSTHSSIMGYSRNAIGDMHQTRWSTLFEQMDKGLTEAEKKLECWLNQVSEMHQYCVKGLQLIQLKMPCWFQTHRISGNKSRLEKMDMSEGELAARAAAASIYSTCKFLMSLQQGQCLYDLVKCNNPL